MKKTILIAVILALVMCMAIVSYTVADSYLRSYPTGMCSFNITVNTTGFTGTTLRARTASEPNAWLKATNEPYLSWQSQWKNLSTGKRYDGFSSPGPVLSAGIAMSYRSPYSGYTEPFLLKIHNNSGSSVNLIGQWHP